MVTPVPLVERPGVAHLIGVGVSQFSDEIGRQLHRYPRTLTEPTGVGKRNPHEHLAAHLDGEQLVAERVVLDRARKRQDPCDQLVASHSTMVARHSLYKLSAPARRSRTGTRACA
jgi:hypothetical protein